MKRTTLTHHIEAFKTEALMILRFQLALERTSRFEDIKTVSRSDFVDRLISLKAIENDLVIRICKFDDTTKGVHSFKKALPEINSAHPNKTEIEKKVKKFSNLIDSLKKTRRHTQLAHLKIGVEDNEYETRYNFRPVINLIVDIIDLMNKSRIDYRWKDGRHEKFDLRQEILND